MSNLHQDLLDAGYREHRHSSYRALRGTAVLFQKRVTDVKGVRYFINCWVYEKDNIVFEEDRPMFEVQFTMKDDEQCNVSPFYDDIQQAEDFFRKLWEKMDFAYDELYH